MKALIYLLGLIAAGVVICWLIWGVTPGEQWNWVKNYTADMSSTVSQHLSDTSNSASKLGNVLSNQLDEASDVYHGKDTQGDKFDRMAREVQSKM